jgi:glycosyltransferase involved in cell wall biosynthesis
MGGAERHAITLANQLCVHFRVVLAYLKPEEDMIEQIDREAIVELCSLRANKRIDIRAARDLGELASKHHASVIVCANSFALLYAHIARALMSCSFAIVEVFHTTKPTTLKTRLAMLLYRPLFWTADHLVFVCVAQRRYWFRRGLWARTTHVIYNGVDHSYFRDNSHDTQCRSARKQLGFDMADRVIGICAVLRPEKAHLDLISAIPRLHREGQCWKLLIIGDGPMRTVIEQEIARLGLGQYVKITGFISDVRDSLAACDIIALVSTSETFSIAALEAMAMGKPVVMSDVGGAREQITNGVNGLLFPAGNVSALVTAISQCWDVGYVRRMGIAARERVKRDFSQQIMIRRYVSLLRSVIDSR